MTVRLSSEEQGFAKKIKDSQSELEANAWLLKYKKLLLHSFEELMMNHVVMNDMAIVTAKSLQELIEEIKCGEHK